MTIAAAAVTGMALLFIAVGFVVVGRALLDDFDEADSVVPWFFSIVGTLLALCTIAVVASLGLLRRRRWAWWTLLALCPITAGLGVVSGYYLLPLGVAAAASTVFVLLLLPATRAWTSDSGPFVDGHPVRDRPSELC
ncbi:hypothetical protein [Nocardioides sp. CER19]|uniref:hypothetical protein n=1 Tax=Nocardioides sp. CER19 TaxID=3038538 RepID=UPI00244795D1|nr:hypothetical protein [Nocardioides sp. CER19]MDH2416489.1 hypothetical protein [Nocardioides sp. CER19]